MENRVLTIGTFDLTHYGHLKFLKECAQYGMLYVGVNSDRFVEEYKKKSPILSQEERMATIAELGAQVALNDGSGRELIEEVKPKILAIGSDWARKDYLKQIGVTQDELDEWGVSVLYIPYTQGISSTEIKQRVTSSLNTNN